jgi:multidrug efflux pump subunit AcrB
VLAEPDRWPRVDHPKSIDNFSQTGFVMLVALAAKNAILIVEYAQDQRK